MPNLKKKMFIEHYQILGQNTSEKCKVLFIIAEKKNLS